MIHSAATPRPKAHAIRLHQSQASFEEAFRLLLQLPADESRYRIAANLARHWAHIDINTAWNTVARSSLSAAEKQIMFNELWS